MKTILGQVALSIIAFSPTAFGQQIFIERSLSVEEEKLKSMKIECNVLTSKKMTAEVPEDSDLYATVSGNGFGLSWHVIEAAGLAVKAENSDTRESLVRKFEFGDRYFFNTPTGRMNRFFFSPDGQAFMHDFYGTWTVSLNESGSKFVRIYKGVESGNSDGLNLAAPLDGRDGYSFEFDRTGSTRPVVSQNVGHGYPHSGPAGKMYRTYSLLETSSSCILSTK